MMELFTLLYNRPHVRVGQQLVPIVDVLAMLDRLDEDEHTLNNCWDIESHHKTLRRINAEMMKQQAQGEAE
jgi:hypothetical protein